MNLQTLTEKFAKVNIEATTFSETIIILSSRFIVSDVYDVIRFHLMTVRTRNGSLYDEWYMLNTVEPWASMLRINWWHGKKVCSYISRAGIVADFHQFSFINECQNNFQYILWFNGHIDLLLNTLLSISCFHSVTVFIPCFTHFIFRIGKPLTNWLHLKKKLPLTSKYVFTNDECIKSIYDWITLIHCVSAS